jgi:hypothetical protein
LIVKSGADRGHGASDAAGILSDKLLPAGHC